MSRSYTSFPPYASMVCFTYFMYVPFARLHTESVGTGILTMMYLRTIHIPRFSGLLAITIQTKANINSSQPPWYFTW
jgi:hypothetical protein